MKPFILLYSLLATGNRPIFCNRILTDSLKPRKKGMVFTSMFTKQNLNCQFFIQLTLNEIDKISPT